MPRAWAAHMVRSKALAAAFIASLVVSGFPPWLGPGGSRTFAAKQSAAQPRFQTSVDVTSVDYWVVDDRGHPINSLTAADFPGRDNGPPRAIVRAPFVSGVA